MQIFVLALCFAVALLHGASSHLVTESVVTRLIENDNSTQKYKRQTDDQLQCVSNRLDVIFEGNTASFVSQCKSVAVAQIQVDTSFQEQLSSFYCTYCNRECGDAINDAYDECDLFSILPAGAEAFDIGLCGINEGGSMCYQLYGDGLTIIRTESSCYDTYISRDVCTCQSELSEAVERQGCCLNVYHNYLSGLTYNPSALYNGCNVNRQSDCTNNQFYSDSGNSCSSGTLSYTSTSTAAIIASSILYAMF